MIELTRFQQLRRVQTLSDEQKLQVGLPLYPDGNSNLSDLAKKLKKICCDKAKYKDVINSFKDSNKGMGLITDIKKVNPVMFSLYNWLDFKARPIKKKDFEQFVQTLKGKKKPDLTNEWNSYADNLLIAIYTSDLSSNYCIDFQLLIRIIYIYHLCIAIKGNDYFLKGSEDQINKLLTLPILLPEDVLNSRCCDCCSENSAKVLPKAKVDLAMLDHAEPNCECACPDTCQWSSTHCICIRTYIGDLFIIKEKLERYEEGDIADIENIMAGEMKVRRHRTLLRTEDTTQTQTETTTSEERDHQVSEKFSLQSEVKNTVDSKNAIDAGVTATLKYGTAVTLTPHANVTDNSSKSNSDSNARSYSKDIVDRSVSSIQEKVTKLQIRKVINEVEERNKHSINNPTTLHKAGIYYWVNKVTHAQVYNYGKHMMFDVIVPEPAAIFKRLYKQKKDSETAEKNLKAPQKPDLDPKIITRNNYGYYLNLYGVPPSSDDSNPPDETTAVQVAFSVSLTEPSGGETTGFSNTSEIKAAIPDGYKAKKMLYDVRCYGDFAKGGGDGPPDEGLDEIAYSVHVGADCISSDSKVLLWGEPQVQNQPVNWQGPTGQGSKAMSGEEGSITVGVAGFASMAASLSGTVSISCEVKDTYMAKWQLKIYDAIMKDYNTKLTAYNNLTQNQDSELYKIKGRNPFLNREIERNELKRNIIAVLMCNYFNGIGSMMERVEPCGYPEINFDQLEKDMPIIQFYEQVFEWDYFNYLFYHSMWARKCKWPELIDEDSGDPLFDKFLMAGASRVQVPIRPGMEDVFSWFLKTGQIWGSSGQPPVSGDDNYVSMIQELKESKQGDYSDRPGLIEATNDPNNPNDPNRTILKLTGSTYYWDSLNIPNRINSLNLDNDIDREILVNYKIYRIVTVQEETNNPPPDHSTWNITIERPYEDASAKNLKHAVGSLFVGAPWEIVIPTELVYLRNAQDRLPSKYPLPIIP